MRGTRDRDAAGARAAASLAGRHHGLRGIRERRSRSRFTDGRGLDGADPRGGARGGRPVRGGSDLLALRVQPGLHGARLTPSPPRHRPEVVKSQVERTPRHGGARIGRGRGTTFRTVPLTVTLYGPCSWSRPGDVRDANTRDGRRGSLRGGPEKWAAGRCWPRSTDASPRLAAEAIGWPRPPRPR